MTNLTTSKVVLPDEVVSFAQNREDLIIFWLLGQPSRGFYVDVGANDPEDFSVTKLFYELGWTGINIEPIEGFYDELCAFRPKDINLKLGVAEKPGVVSLREYENAEGLSTMSVDTKKAVANQYKFKEYNVPVEPLRSILPAHLPVGTKIDFMKVDVEGYEYQVLASNDWRAYRPRLLCIEANHIHKDWRSILQKAGYGLVFFDGLNEYWAENTEEVKARLGDYAEIFLSGRIVEQERYYLRRVASDKEVRKLKTSVERFHLAEQQTRQRLAKMHADIEFFNNLSIKLSLKQLLKAVYRSVRFRVLGLIWGKASGYQDTTKLTELAEAEVTTNTQAKTALAAIDATDKDNSRLLFRNQKVRRFIFEQLRSTMLVTRKLLKTLQRRGNV